jgi:hypothetical protein
LQPFPFRAPGFTFSQFANLLHQGALCSVARLTDPDGDGTAALYRFTRHVPGKVIDIIEYVGDDTWPMMASTFRSLCHRLSVDPAFLAKPDDGYIH